MTGNPSIALLCVRKSPVVIDGKEIARKTLDLGRSYGGSFMMGGPAGVTPGFWVHVAPTIYRWEPLGCFIPHNLDRRHYWIREAA